MHKISGEVVRFITKTMNHWKLELTVGGKL